MASRKKTDLHPILAEAYEKAIVQFESKFPDSPIPFLTCTYRSDKEQEQLYTQIPKVTNAKAGQSPHNYSPSLAFDLAFITVGKQLDWSVVNFGHFADIIEDIDNRIEWGGGWVSFKDNPHYQLKNWRTFIP